MTTVIRKPDVWALVQHTGLPGPAGAPGAAGEVQGPASAVVGNLAAFASTDGNSIADTGVALSALATAAALALKEDKVAGKGLSANDFTTTLKDKLDALSPGGFVGTFVNLVALDAAFPTATTGSYAFVVPTTPGTDQILYHWDSVNTAWLPIDLSDKVDKVSGKGLSQNDFTNAYKGLVDTAVQTTTFDAAVAAFNAAITAVTNNVVTEATVARTLATTDGGRYIDLTNGAGCTITLPNDATGLWTGNPEVRFMISSSTIPTISLGAGVTLQNAAALSGLAQYDTFSVKRIAADFWHLIL